MAKKTGSKHQKELHKAYALQNTWKKNKIKRMQRHVAKHPNDKQSVARLENPDKLTYTRNRRSGGRVLDVALTVLGNEIRKLPGRLPRGFKDQLRPIKFAIRRA